MTRDSAYVDLWLNATASSTTYRKRFGHDPKKWIKLRHRDKLALSGNTDAIEQLDRYFVVA